MNVHVRNQTIFGISGFAITEYAISANAILGIRDSGKTYTATEASEELFEATIPFVWLDPIGVAHNLRIPGKGRGYPVVVAGGKHGDLPLTVKNAGAILRAAMKSGVSLIIDLFSVELSKADWRRIVKECATILLHENADYGLRHVFIEEAAEFVPQKPMDYDVFAAVEKLVRMGGNSKVGVTLINQRSADLNKSVLELCANVFVHRQKGKNTLLDLKKWFTLLDLSEAEQRKIAESLPNLKSGQAWALINDLDKPVFFKVPEKNSLHPDRRAAAPAPGATKREPVAADKFVEAMKTKLAEADAKKTAPAAKPAAVAPTSQPVEKINTAAQKQQERAIAAAIEQARQTAFPEGWAAAWPRAFAAGAKAQRILLGQVAEPTLTDVPPAPRAPKINAPAGTSLFPNPPSQGKHDAGSGAVAQRIERPASTNRASRREGSVRDRVLRALAELEAIGVNQPPRIQAAFLAGYKHDGVPNFRNTAGALRSEGLVEYPTTDTIALTDAGRTEAPAVDTPLTSADLHERIISLLGGVEARIIPPLIECYPGAISRDELAKIAGYAHAGVPNFRNSLGRLRSLGFVGYPDTSSAIAKPVLFLEGR